MRWACYTHTLRFWTKIYFFYTSLLTHKTKESSLPCSTAERRRDRFMPFLGKAVRLNEMKKDSSRNWTCITMFILGNDNYAILTPSHIRITHHKKMGVYFSDISTIKPIRTKINRQTLHFDLNKKKFLTSISCHMQEYLSLCNSVVRWLLLMSSVLVGFSSYSNLVPLQSYHFCFILFW